MPTCLVESLSLTVTVSSSSVCLSIVIPKGMPISSVLAYLLPTVVPEKGIGFGCTATSSCSWVCAWCSKLTHWAAKRLRPSFPHPLKEARSYFQRSLRWLYARHTDLSLLWSKPLRRWMGCDSDWNSPQCWHTSPLVNERASIEVAPPCWWWGQEATCGVYQVWDVCFLQQIWYPLCMGNHLWLVQQRQDSCLYRCNQGVESEDCPLGIRLTHIEAVLKEAVHDAPNTKGWLHNTGCERPALGDCDYTACKQRQCQ